MSESSVQQQPEDEAETARWEAQKRSTETKENVKDAVWCELLECYSEGENTDWHYLTDLCDLIVDMIERHGPALRSAQ